MLDSIYTGITGVRSHQERINVISNNVANINTIGFKGGRASFSDVMSKTLSEGTSARNSIAATNPRQIGLGVQIGSIDTVMRQGTLQNTGIETDLAIEGDGMFIVSDGNRDFYTRDGSFAFDAEGTLIDPSTGLKVKGNIAQSDDVSGIKFEPELKELVVPFDRESEAVATTVVHLSGNLDAAGSPPQEWDENTVFGTPALHTGATGAVDLVALAGTPGPTDPPLQAKLKLTLDEAGTVSEGTLDVPIKSYSTVDELSAQLNALVNANEDLRGKVLFKSELVGANTSLVLRSAQGGANVSLTVDDASTSTVAITSLLGFTRATAALGGASSAAAAAPTALNELANVGRALTSGDVVRITGVKPSGDRFDGDFTFATGSDDLRSLLDSVQDAYGGGVTVNLDDITGKLLVTDTNGRVTGLSINMSLIDQAATADLKSALLGDNAPFEFSTNTQIFDEQGQSHSLSFTFTKSLVDNEWDWVSTMDGVTPDAGNVGKAIFNSDGTIDSFSATDGSGVLRVTPDGGVTALSVRIAIEPTDRLGGLTQFVAPSSVSVREQDGRAAGRLVSVTIEPNGHIKGQFDNGDAQVLARIPLASFSNPGGLRRLGGNLFGDTSASGPRLVGEAESEIQGTVRSRSLELSNVDLAEEFTNLIVTQRGFQASARSITTADELLSELVNLKR